MKTHEHQRVGEPADDAQDQTRLQQEILQAVKDVRFGSVEVTIHDSKVVQVERREKFRFQHRAR